MQIQAELNQLIHAIYRGVMEEEPWTSFLNQLNQVFASDLAVLVVVPNRQPGNKYLLNRVVNSQSGLASSANHWIALDPFQDIEPDQPLRLDELQQGQQIAVEDSSFYRDVIRSPKTSILSYCDAC